MLSTGSITLKVRLLVVLVKGLIFPNLVPILNSVYQTLVKLLIARSTNKTVTIKQITLVRPVKTIRYFLITTPVLPLLLVTVLSQYLTPQLRIVLNVKDSYQ